jgi:hypothetical protein
MRGDEKGPERQVMSSSPKRRWSSAGCAIGRATFRVPAARCLLFLGLAKCARRGGFLKGQSRRSHRIIGRSRGLYAISERPFLLLSRIEDIE